MISSLHAQFITVRKIIQIDRSSSDVKRVFGKVETISRVLSETFYTAHSLAHALADDGIEAMERK